jgi:hypothetical protein
MTHEDRVADPFALLSGDPSQDEATLPHTVYRLGFWDAPLDFTPRDDCSWQHRWDDPDHEHRTLYCARSAVTSLREALASLRPNAKVLAELREHYSPGRVLLQGLGVVSDAWFDMHVLAEATIVSNGPLVDVDDAGVREDLMRRHAKLLHRLGIRYLDITELRGRQRMITQTIRQTLWDQGAAGIRYRSNLDDGECYALFEGRAALMPTGAIMHFTPHMLLRVARTYHLQVTYDGWRERYVKDAT